MSERKNPLLHADAGAHPGVRPRARGALLGLRVPDHHGRRPRLRLPRPSAGSRARRRRRRTDGSAEISGRSRRRALVGPPILRRRSRKGLAGAADRKDHAPRRRKRRVRPGLVYHFDPTRPDARDRAARGRRRDPALPRPGRPVDPTPGRSSTRRARATSTSCMPGILGLNLMGTGIWGIGFSIVTARLKKTLKLMVATPMRHSRLPAGADPVAIRVPGRRGRRHPRFRRLRRSTFRSAAALASSALVDGPRRAVLRRNRPARRGARHARSRRRAA